MAASWMLRRLVCAFVCVCVCVHVVLLLIKSITHHMQLYFHGVHVSVCM